MPSQPVEPTSTPPAMHIARRILRNAFLPSALTTASQVEMMMAARSCVASSYMTLSPDGERQIPVPGKGGVQDAYLTAEVWSDVSLSWLSQHAAPVGP